jgi:hypothetical protein
MFDPKLDPRLATKLLYFHIFTADVVLLGQSASGITTVAQNMDRIQGSMKLFKEHINGMDLKKLTTTNSLFQAIAAMSKNPEAMAKAIVASMNKSFEELIKALKELAAANTPPGGNGNGNGNGPNPPSGPPLKPGQKPPAGSGGGDVAADNAAASKAGAQKVYVVNAPAGWK